ncbi:MAG: hypothetical protein WCJ40_13085 [Planctomycetota bacterium]
MNIRRKVCAFRPEVTNLESREVPAHIGIAPKVAMVHAANANNAGVMPISVLAGSWDGVFNASAFGVSQYPSLPTGMTSHLDTTIKGNELTAKISNGSTSKAWSYTITGNDKGQLKLSMADPFNPSVILNASGKRIGAAAWAFEARIPMPGAPVYRIVMAVINRNTYFESTSQATQGVLNPVFHPLYEVTNTRAVKS